MPVLNVQAVDPAKRPIGNGETSAGLDVALPQPLGECRPGVESRSTPDSCALAPILVRREVDHLMNDGIADPGALLSGGAVGVGVEGVELNGADTGLIKSIEPRIVAAKIRPTGARIEVLAHLEPLQGHRDWLVCMDDEVR